MSFFDQFQRSVWRLEVQPFYQPDADEFGRHQQGLSPTAEQAAQRAGWVAQVAEATAAGRSIGRVLLIALPLSPYWRWRLETAREHVAAGEDIRIVIADDLPELVNPSDFWLLDDELVMWLAYDPAGRYLGMTTHSDPSMLRYRRRQRDLAVAASVPLQEFLLPA